MENGPETDYNLANRCGYEFQTLACYKVVVIFKATCIFRFYFASYIKCYILFCLKYMYFLLSVKNIYILLLVSQNVMQKPQISVFYPLARKLD